MVKVPADISLRSSARACWRAFFTLDAPVRFWPCATPPMWKVRMVNWVPGSPMDCAAMMPTASPVSTAAPVAMSVP